MPRLIASSILLLGLSTSAHALEGKALFDKLLAHPGFSNAKVTWQTLQEDDASSFAMTGLRIESTNDQAIDINALVVKGLKETDDGRVIYDSITVSQAKGDLKREGTFGLEGVVSTAGDIPVDALADGEISKDERHHRIKFGNFTLSGFSLANDEGSMGLDSFVTTEADIPLHFEYQEIEGEGGQDIAPLLLGLVAMQGWSFNAPKQNMDAKLGSLSLSGLKIPASLSGSSASFLDVYKSFSVADVAFKLAGQDLFGLESISGQMTAPDAAGDITQSASMRGMTINLEAIPDPNTQIISQQLGYKVIEMSMDGSGSYNPGSGVAQSDNMVLRLRDMFDLNMGYKISGYTEEVVNRIQKIQLRAAAKNAPDGGFSEMLPELAQIKIDNIKIDLTDRSLTGKLLDFQAQQMGTTGEQLAAGVPLLIGAGMANLQMPEFTKMVSEAVGKFLQEKGTLSMSATPSEPVPVSQIMVQGQSDPRKIPDLLQFKVSAE